MNFICGNSSVGRASASQAEGREFEPRFPLSSSEALAKAEAKAGLFLIIPLFSLSDDISESH